MSTTPAAAATTARKSRPRRERATVSTSGPRNSIVTATPIGSRPSEA